jgi:hypothetical protein
VQRDRLLSHISLFSTEIAFEIMLVKPEAERTTIVHPYHIGTGSWDSTISIATGYGLQVWGGRVKNFLFSTSYGLAVEPTQPPVQWVQRNLSSGVKRLGREAGYSPPANAKVKKMWIYTSTTPYVFMAWCLIS